MSENLTLSQGLNREDTYKEIIPQIKALIAGESDVIANLANVAAVLKEAFGFLWIGFYFVKGKELVLGPFQGPIACTRIKKGKGVCGLAWLDNKTIIVPDVDQFPGHIACSSQSKSEFVIPVLKNSEVHLILDIDSDQLNDFSEIDDLYLKKIIRIVEQVIA